MLAIYCFLFSPEQRFSDLVREDSEEDPSPKLILKRQDSLSDESGPLEVCLAWIKTKPQCYCWKNGNV